MPARRRDFDQDDLSFGGVDYWLDEDRFDRDFDLLSRRLDPFDFNWRVW